MADHKNEELGAGDDHGKGKDKGFTFFVSGKKYETDQPTLSGLQIKAKVADWDQSHDLVLEGHGNDPDRIIADGETVNMDGEHGPLRFSSAPKANFG